MPLILEEVPRIGVDERRLDTGGSRVLPPVRMEVTRLVANVVGEVPHIGDDRANTVREHGGHDVPHHPIFLRRGDREDADQDYCQWEHGVDDVARPQ